MGPQWLYLHGVPRYTSQLSPHSSRDLPCTFRSVMQEIIRRTSKVRQRRRLPRVTGPGSPGPCLGNVEPAQFDPSVKSQNTWQSSMRSATWQSHVKPNRKNRSQNALQTVETSRPPPGACWAQLFEQHFSSVCFPKKWWRRSLGWIPSLLRAYILRKSVPHSVPSALLALGIWHGTNLARTAGALVWANGIPVDARGSKDNFDRFAWWDRLGTAYQSSVSAN